MQQGFSQEISPLILPWWPQKSWSGKLSEEHPCPESWENTGSWEVLKITLEICTLHRTRCCTLFLYRFVLSLFVGFVKMVFVLIHTNCSLCFFIYKTSTKCMPSSSLQCNCCIISSPLCNFCFADFLLFSFPKLQFDKLNL